MRINPYAGYQAPHNDARREATKELGKDEFLKILAAQFRDQNPLEPVGDTEFIAQMAQFSSLEQLQNISDQLEVFAEDMVWGQYLSLLGKEIYALNDEDELIEGIVSGVSFKNGDFQLEIDGQEHDIVAIISVGMPPEPKQEPIVVVVPEAATGEVAGDD